MTNDELVILFLPELNAKWAVEIHGCNLNGRPPKYGSIETVFTAP
jgi:hypothetical protein